MKLYVITEVDDAGEAGAIIKWRNADGTFGEYCLLPREDLWPYTSPFTCGDTSWLTCPTTPPWTPWWSMGRHDHALHHLPRRRHRGHPGRGEDADASSRPTASDRVDSRGRGRRPHMGVVRPVRVAAIRLGRSFSGTDLCTEAMSIAYQRLADAGVRSPEDVVARQTRLTL